MPPRSRARTGQGELASAVEQQRPRVPAESPQPSRKSARILRKAEERQSQSAPTPRKRSSSKKVRDREDVPLVPNSRKGKTTRKKNGPARIPGETTTQAPKRKYTKKATKASPIAVAGREPVLGPRNSSANQIRSKAISKHHRSEASLTDSSERLTVAPEIVEFYHSRGYEVPDEVLMASSVKGRKQSSKASSRRPKKPPGYAIDSEDSRFTAALLDHNISNLSEKDPEIKYYERLMLDKDSNTSGSLSTLEREIQREIHRREDSLWKTDMSKCARSNEARFQRTVMMTILNRQELDDKLDFNCEAQWISGRFPCPEACMENACQITKPKPDLAVAFQSRSLLPANGFMADFERLKIWQCDIFPEGNQEFNNERAFYFFSMEVKGKRGQIDNQKAQFQNLNTASQALFNIYRCMKRVNDLDTFFNKVRVFSAVATIEGLSLRIHRPIRLDKEQCNDEDYPIGFQFDNLEHLRGAYSRAQATAIVYNILYEYGVLQLHLILKDTIQKLLKLHPRKKGSRPSLQDLEQAAAAQAALAEIDPAPASQESSGQKRRAHNLGDSFASNSRRRLDNFNLSDSAGSTVSFGG